MATTAKGIPYPLTTDNNDSQLWFQNLATWLDTFLGGMTTAAINALTGGAKFAGRVQFDTDKGQLMFCDGTTWHAASVPVGGITWLGATSTPDGYLLCDGTASGNRTTHAKLFAKISTVYGVGDGTTTFNVPNIKGRVIVGFDASQTEFDVVGETGGAKTVTLTNTQLPVHSHVGGSHTHTIDHDHASFSSSTAPDHQHGVTYGATQPAGSGSAFTSLQNVAGVTGLAGAHVHTIDPPAFSGTSGSGGAVATATNGAGAAFSILTPYITLQPYIKF